MVTTLTHLIIANQSDIRRVIGLQWMVLVMREEKIHFCATIEQIYIVIDLLSTDSLLWRFSTLI